jgi:LAS superfamily LD-carboxypeptidase LdcB
MAACQGNSPKNPKISQLDEPMKQEAVEAHTLIAESDIMEDEVKEAANVENPKVKTVTLESAVQKSAEFDTDYLMGKFDPNTHPDFSAIAVKYASNSTMRMRTDAYNTFIQMYDAAKKEGISLKIISATRPFHHQKSIWEAKWNGQRQVDGKMLPKNMDSNCKKIFRS